MSGTLDLLLTLFTPNWGSVAVGFFIALIAIALGIVLFYAGLPTWGVRVAFYGILIGIAEIIIVSGITNAFEAMFGNLQSTVITLGVVGTLFALWYSFGDKIWNRK